MLLKIKNIFTVILGTVIVAVALDVFLAPGNIAPGGVSGLSIVTNYLTNIRI